MNAETIKKASAVYFTLLKEKVIDETSEHFQTYFEPEVRQTVLLLADESGTYIIESPKRIHLVVQPTGSVFATNFTHMREKHRQIETKKHFHLDECGDYVFFSNYRPESGCKDSYEAGRD